MRIQFTQGVSLAEQKEIQASIANHVNYGYVQHKDKKRRQSFVIKGTPLTKKKKGKST